MLRRRFFAPREQISNGVAFLPPDQIHHLRGVLRLNAGDEVEVFDGEGDLYLGVVQIRGAETRIVRLEKLSVRDEPQPHVILAPALIKADRFEWMLEKATELGADEIIPLETRFTEIRITRAKIQQRMERWRRIIREAARQCRRLYVPRIQEPVRFSALLSAGHLPLTRLLLFEKADTLWDCILSPSAELLICTGPEGGWDSTEVEAAGKAGFGIFRIGSRILRAETAPLAALSIVQFVAQVHKTPR
jgi:16S rRNA (uracil1498-N3)-methyltransferase